MNYNELLAFLDLENPSEFKYFETMADLIESDEYIEQEAVYRLFSEVDKTELTETFNQYFEEVTGNLPEDSDEIFSLFENIRLCLTGLADNAEDDGDYRKLADEFCRFRNWYVNDSEVEIMPENGSIPIESQCLRDGITTVRINRLQKISRRYDFSKALDYEIDSYTMSFAELAAVEDTDDEQ